MLAVKLWTRINVMAICCGVFITYDVQITVMWICGRETEHVFACDCSLKSHRRRRDRT